MIPFYRRAVIRETTVFCMQCRSFVPGKVVEFDSKIWLQRNCDLHGVHHKMISKNPLQYRLIETIIPRTPTRPIMYSLPGNLQHPRGIFLNITEQCNLHCPNCLTDASPQGESNPLNRKDFLDALKNLLPWRPFICLSGGEPTLAPDLFEWISTLQKNDYTVKLLTNGIKLADEKYCRELQRAGLRWVLLQFDSLEEKVVSALRGRPGLAAVRARVLDNLSRLRFKVCLSTMIERNFNLNELGELIRFGFRTPCVHHISLLPARRIGRNLLTGDEDFIDEFDVMDAIACQTENGITRKDWLLFFALTAAAYKLSRSVNIKPRRCFFTLPVLGTEDRFYPATRIKGFVRDPANALAFLKMISRAGRIEEAGLTQRVLLLSIEAFREIESIDILDVMRCSRYYFADGKFYTPCLYQTIGRRALANLV